MSALAELQRDFAEAVRGSAAAGEGLAIRAAGLAAERRLAVYRNHHRISLAGALAANFPTVAAVIGAEAFQVLAADFVAAEPPTDACVAAYGAGFAEFLERDARARELGYLGDVARLDWARNLAERADDFPTFGPKHLAGLDEIQLQTLILAPHPGMTLLRSAYPLLQIGALARGETEAVSLDAGGVDLMVWRRDDAVVVHALDPSAADAVSALLAGEPLGAAAQSLAPEALPSFLAQAVLAGAFLAPAAMP